MRRPLTALAAGLLFVAALAGCTRSSPPAAGRLTVDGQAEVLRPGEDRRDVAGSLNLKAGDRVRVRQGSAVIRLSENRQLELRMDSDVELLKAAEPVNVRPNIIGGDLLVISDDRPFVVGGANADVAVQGDARVSRGLALLVATYEGSAQLSAGGSTLTVPALRQAALRATGEFPTAVTALEFSAADSWDLRYLSDAMDLSSLLSGRSNAFSSQLGLNEGRSFAYFRDLFPRLAAEPGFTAGLVNPARPPGDTLVGAAITLEGTRGTFAERWAAVFGFRDQNAEWGLVTLDQGVARAALLATMDGAVSRAPTQFAAGPPIRPPTSPNPPGISVPTTAAPTTTTTVARPRPGPTTTTTTPPAAGGTSTTVVGPINTGTPLDATLNSLVNTLTGLLNSLSGK